MKFHCELAILRRPLKLSAPWISSRTYPKKQAKALSVTQVVRRMKRAIEADVGKLWIEGEVSNLKKQGSGHWYFSLKDEGSQIQCAMFGAREQGGLRIPRGRGAGADFRGCHGLPRPRPAPGHRGKGRALRPGRAAGALRGAEGKAQRRRTVRFVSEETRARIPAHHRHRHLPDRRCHPGHTQHPHPPRPWVQPVLFPVHVQGKGVEREIASAINKLNAPEEIRLPALRSPHRRARRRIAGRSLVLQ